MTPSDVPDAEPDPPSRAEADRFQQVQALFWEAVEHPPSDRIAWVRQQGLSPDIESQVVGAVRADLSSSSWHQRDSAEQHDALAETITSDAPAQVETTAARPFPQLDNYEILEEIDRGGMGIVYRARQLRPSRQVAIKMMRMGAFCSQLDVERFLNEANAASGLSHSAVVPVYEVGEISGEPFIVMKFIDGATLEKCLKAERISTHDAIRLLLVVARAIADAHDHAIVHRDLKPSNILVDNSSSAPWVLDFGLAKSLAQESDLTAAGDIMGTPGYMAPEQAQGHSDRVTPAADVYGLGAVLYRILTGQAPIESRGGDFAETMQLVREHDVIPPRARNRHVPMEMDAVCMKALETEPASRYQHARDFADDLQRCLVGETTEARQTSIVRRVHRWARHRPGLAATIAVVLLFYSYHLVALATGLLVAGDLFQQTVNLIVPLALLNAFLWQWALKKTSGASWTLYAWSTGEILMVTVVIANGDGASSGLISTLFVLVAVSTLRCRRMLVAYVTALCLLSYVYLWITSLEGPMTAPDILQAVPRILNLLLIGLIQYLSVIRSSVSFEASGGQRQIADTGDRNAG